MARMSCQGEIEVLGQEIKVLGRKRPILMRESNPHAQTFCRRGEPSRGSDAVLGTQSKEMITGV